MSLQWCPFDLLNVNICWMVWVDVPIRSVNISWINPRDWCCRDLFEISILADNYIFNRIWLFIPKWDICWVPPAWPCSSISRPGGGSCLMWGKASLSGLSWYHMLCGEISFQFLSMTCTPHLTRLSLLTDTTLTGTFQANLQWGNGRAERISNINHLSPLCVYCYKN